MTPRDLATLALGTVLLSGLTVEQSIAHVAAEHSVDPDEVRAAVRACRYLCYEQSSPGPVARRLLDSLPGDVVPIPYGRRAVHEQRQIHIMATLGAVVTALPCVVAWVPEHVGEEETIPGHYAQTRLSDDADWADLDEGE
jgi:hypothetical protein